MKVSKKVVKEILKYEGNGNQISNKVVSHSIWNANQIAEDMNQRGNLDLDVKPWNDDLLISNVQESINKSPDSEIREIKNYFK